MSSYVGVIKKYNKELAIQRASGTASRYRVFFEKVLPVISFNDSGLPNYAFYEEFEAVNSKHAEMLARAKYKDLKEANITCERVV